MSASGQPDPSTRSRGLAGVALRCQPDARLTSLARDGYEEAFEEIARRYRASLTSFAGSIVPANRAEDVVQDAFVKAYRSLPKAEPDLNLRPWLYTIVRNTALNNLRDEPVHERLHENWDGVPQPPEVAARRAELAALVHLIHDLPGPQREALVRRELEGRSHEEIASRLGTSPGAVRGLIFRARTALRDGLGMLIPTAVLQTMMSGGGGTQPEAGAAGVGVAAAGLTAGGGGMATKVGGALVVGVLAIGSGIAIHERAQRHDSDRAPVADAATPAPGGGARTGPPARALGESPAPRGGASGRGSGESGSRDGSSGRDRGSSVPESASSGTGGGGSSGPGEGAGAESRVAGPEDGSGAATDGRSSSGRSGSGSSGGSGTSGGGSGSDDAVVDSGEGGAATSGAASSSGGDDGSLTLDAGSLSGGTSTTSSDGSETLRADG